MECRINNSKLSNKQCTFNENKYTVNQLLISSINSSHLFYLRFLMGTNKKTGEPRVLSEYNLETRQWKTSSNEFETKQE